MDMAACDLELQHLGDRVAKLERQNRFWRLGGLFGALLFACSLAIGVKAQQDHGNIIPPSKSIESESFVLTDAAGVTRGELTVKNGEPQLELYNAGGKVTWSTRSRIVTQGQ